MPARPFRLATLPLLVACTNASNDPIDPIDPEPTHSDQPPGEDTDFDDSVPDTDPPDDPGPAPTYDCAALPAGPLPFRSLLGLAVNEDFAFDDEGHLLAFAAPGVLVRQTYPPVTTTPVVALPPGGGAPASLRALPGGDLVYADVDTATLYRVTPAGGLWPVHSGLGYPTGIDIHPSGKVFLADLTGVLRIDPDNGDTTVLIEPEALRMPNGMSFSADYHTLHVGTLDGIYSVPVDDDGVPTAAPAHRGNSPGGAEMLGMGVDACDGLYVLLRDTLLRYRPGAGREELIRTPPGAWMTNLQWGSGVGGWDAHKLYITDRQGTTPAYYEVDVGVPSKPYAYP
jgi:hypothetical protein